MSAPESLPPDVAAITELILPHRLHLTATEVADQAGVSEDLAVRLRRAMGIPDADKGEAVYNEYDRDALLMAHRVLDEGRLSEAEVLHLTRTLGLAASRMADAVVSFWADGVTATPDRMVSDPDDLPGLYHIDDLERTVVFLLRRHLLAAAVRRLGMGGAESAQAVAVGFADLVGFTSLSQQLSDQETAQLVERFEILATDRVVAGSGRVIKMIGDEVMFSSAPEAVGEIALGLADAFNSPDLPAVRVGLACGPVVSQSGDLFGPVVNLASRATMSALPGSVLVAPSLAEILGQDPRYRLKTLKPRRLKGIGTVELSVLRRAKPPG